MASDTVDAVMEPSVCLVPVTLTFAPFFVASAHVVCGYVVALFTVILVPDTVNVTAGHAPVEPEMTPLTVAGDVTG